MMKMKRMTALVTLVVFMFSCIALNASADTTAATTETATTVAGTGSVFADVTGDTQYATAIQKLYDDKIVDGYLAEDGTRTFKPLDTITRGEFAKLLVASKIKNVPTTLNATTCGFSDVDTDPTLSWTIPYVDYAVKAAIVNGYEDGTFRAKNTVKYSEAVKMVVCAMGYASVIEKTEPWYNGYIKVAQQIGITGNGAYSAAEEPASRGLVAQLIYNMNTSKKQVSVIPGGNAGSGSGGGNFILNDNDDDEDEYEIAGMVTGVFQKGVEGEAGLSRDEIMIEDTVFKIGNIDIESLEKYLGYYIDVVYIQDGSKNIIQGSFSTNGLNDVIELEPEQIEDVFSDHLTYYKNEDSTKTTKLKFENDMKIIYNGVGVADVDGELIETLLDIDNGSIKLVDGDVNGSYDTAFVTTYETFFVSTSESVTKTVTDKYFKNGNVAKSITFDEEEENIEFKTASGASSTFSAIRQNSVISVARPYDTTTPYGKTTVIISTNTTTGVVTGIDANNDIYTIGSNDIKASKYYLALVQQEPSQVLETGDAATYYLDYAGNLVAISATDTNKYGYIIDVIEPEGANRNDVTVRMVTSTSSIAADYKLNENGVTINGKSYEPSEVADVLKASADKINVTNGKEAAGLADNATYSQPIIFKTKSSSSNMISTISTVAADSDDENYIEYNKGAVSGGIKSTFASGNVFKRDSSTVFSMKFGTSSSTTNSVTTKVFVVPSDRSDEEEYTVRTTSGYFTTDKTYCVEGFNVDSTTGNAEIVVVYGGTPVEVTGATKAYIIQEVKPDNVYNIKGDKASTVYYYELGGSDDVQSFVTDAAVSVAGLKAGDIIKVGKKKFGDDELVTLIEKVVIDKVLYKPAQEDGTQDVATEFYMQDLYGGDPDYYNAFMGTVFSYADNQLQLIKDLDIDLDVDAEDYAEKLAELEKEILTTSSSAKVYYVDSTANAVEERIKIYTSAESVVAPLFNGTNYVAPSAASKIFVSRSGTGNISVIVIFK
ncbi:MAG: S-layer homology domain-containing protein [Ruminococcaceae bacterium]|nr:S-layer homology domain-containing protein [Oscillospiraceae bacterium]